MRFEVFRGLDGPLGQKGPWRFRLRANNGEPIAASEGYVNKQDCIATIRSIQANSCCAPIVIESDSTERVSLAMLGRPPAPSVLPGLTRGPVSSSHFG